MPRGRRAAAAHDRSAQAAWTRRCSAPSRRSRSRRPRPSSRPRCSGKGLRLPLARSSACGSCFDLYVCLRPCKAYPGNPLNYKEGIDLVIFRENTEDLYSGVEFNPVPAELQRRARRSCPSRSRAFADLAARRVRGLVQDQHAQGLASASSAPRSSSPATHGRTKVTVVHKANVVRATDGLFLEIGARGGASDFPGIAMDEANIDAITMWLLKNPNNYDVLVAPNLYGDIISDLCAQMVGGLGFGCSGNIGEQAGGVRADARLGAQVRRPVQGQPDRHDPRREDDARLARRDGEGPRGSSAAVAAVIAEGRVRTYDMGGTATHARHGATPSPADRAGGGR